MRNQAPRLNVPDGWSAEQALAVLDFLEDLHAAIWQHYEDPIAAALLLEPTSTDQAQTPSDKPDETPF